jgi:hypothetical protein
MVSALQANVERVQATKKYARLRKSADGPKRTSKAPSMKACNQSEADFEPRVVNLIR